MTENNVTAIGGGPIKQLNSYGKGDGNAETNSY